MKTLNFVFLVNLNGKSSRQVVKIDNAKENLTGEDAKRLMAELKTMPFWCNSKGVSKVNPNAEIIKAYYSAAVHEPLFDDEKKLAGNAGADTALAA